MKNIFKISAAIVILIAIVSILWPNERFSAQASVPVSNGYMYKTITTSNASSTAPTVVTIKTNGTNGQTILGSIIVASSSNTVIKLYDGNATTGTTTGTLISTIKANIAEQTLTYDVNVKLGLLVDMPQTFTGVYTVSFR